jgi:hypothetical protein
MQSVAQRCDTGRAPTNAGIRPTLQDHQRSTSQNLQARHVYIALPVSADFCQQPGSQAVSGSRKALTQGALGMAQKKLFDVLVVRSDLLDRLPSLCENCRNQFTRGGPGGLRSGRRVHKGQGQTPLKRGEQIDRVLLGRMR